LIGKLIYIGLKNRSQKRDNGIRKINKPGNLQEKRGSEEIGTEVSKDYFLLWKPFTKG